MTSFKYFALLLIVPSCLGLFDPYKEGPWIRRTLTIGMDHNEDLEFELRVSAPVGEGFFPVIYFLGSFHMNTPNFVYGELFDKLASNGFVVVSMWRVTMFSDHESTTNRINDAISWIERELPRELTLDYCPFDELHCPTEWLPFPRGFNVSKDGFYMITHSSAAPDIVRILLDDVEQSRKRAKGVVLLSAVDGGDPWGMTGDFVTPEDGTTLPIVDLPALVMMAGLDPVPGWDLPFYPACAPEGMSNIRFYDAWNSPKWFLNSTQFGHADIMTDFFADLATFTGLCAGADYSLDRETYRTFVVGQIVSFVSAIENPEENCGMLSYLEDTSMMVQENVVAFHDAGEESPCPFVVRT